MTKKGFLESTISGDKFHGTLSEQQSMGRYLMKYDQGILQPIPNKKRCREKLYGEIEERLHYELNVRVVAYQKANCGLSWSTLQNLSCQLAQELGYDCTNHHHYHDMDQDDGNENDNVKGELTLTPKKQPQQPPQFHASSGWLSDTLRDYLQQYQPSLVLRPTPTIGTSTTTTTTTACAIPTTAAAAQRHLDALQLYVQQQQQEHTERHQVPLELRQLLNRVTCEFQNHFLSLSLSNTTTTMMTAAAETNNDSNNDNTNQTEEVITK